ncbi:MAG: hypothetical protein JO352_03915 [Chloroflexi bacterium]|nr:hypothetical protein [Chloroflexota bacterium]MBV9597832.1 hypothetical protein [Chloroflexota bacterium]
MQRWLDWAIGGYLVFAAVQAFGIGMTGLILPPEMQIPLRLTPLNARFVAALYVAGGVGIVLALFAPRRASKRLMCVGFGLATLLILCLTLLHWPDFMDDGLPHRPVWMFVYVADPLLAVLIVPLAGLWPPRPGNRHSLTPLLRVEAAVLGMLALVLLLAPEAAAAYWPWALPPVAGQLYACFILTFAIGAVLAARETDTRAIRDFLIASLSLCILVLLASLLHLDRFNPAPNTVVWFALFGCGALALGWAVASVARQPVHVQSAART